MVGTFRRLRELQRISKIKDEEELMKFDDKERAIIDVGAENYDDIFSPFCLYDMNVLDFELEDYLDNKSDSIPLEYDLKLIFYIKDADEEKRKEIETTVKQNYENKVHTLSRKISQNNIFSLLMLLGGAAFLLLHFYLKSINTPELLLSVFEIASWVLTWTAVDAFFLERKLLQVEEIMTYRLINAKVQVKEFMPKHLITRPTTVTPYNSFKPKKNYGKISRAKKARTPKEEKGKKTTNTTNANNNGNSSSNENANGKKTNGSANNKNNGKLTTTNQPKNESKENKENNLS